MNPRDNSPEDTGASQKRKSLLYNLWNRAIGADGESDGEGETATDGSPQEEASSAQPAPPKRRAPLTYEKNVAPEWMALYCRRWRNQQGLPIEGSLLVEDFCGENVPEQVLLKPIFSQIDGRARVAMERLDSLMRVNLEKEEAYLKSAMKAGEQPENLPEVLAEPSISGDFMLFHAPNWSAAWVMVLPPMGDGAPVEEEAIREALAQKGIIFGLAEDKIRALGAGKLPLVLTQVAAGVAPIRGDDGKLIEHFPRTIGTPHFVEDERGVIDFGNLNWLTPIEEGTVICEVIPPTPGKPGTDIRSRTVKPYNGKKATLPAGDNVALNKEGTALVAKVTGQISFKNEKYHVSNVIVIPGNVDHSTGSLNVRGDLVIHGNVLAGFTIQASGDITVDGIVEGSQVTAGGSIMVNRGMNGNLVGTLIAGKDIFCKYMENATVHADGDIHMDSIVNCDVTCNGRIYARSGRGVVIGGSILAMGGIEAKIVGNKAGRLTVLSIGPTPQFLRERDLVEKDLEAIRYELSVLVGSKKATPLNTKILQMKESVLQKRMDQLAAREASIPQGRIVLGKLYPIVQVSIGGIVRPFTDMHNNCRIYLDSREAEIRITDL